MRRSTRRFLLSALVTGAITASASDANLKARLKWFSTAAVLPAEDFQRQLDETPAYDYNADLRVVARADAWEGKVRLLADYSVTWVAGDSFAFASAPQQTLDQSPTDDSLRLMDLTWEIDEGDRHQAFHRFDRLAIEYRTRNLGVTIGRQAVSWGSGRVFQPMDLFNPFAPTTVDRDYKPGDDIILIEQALPASDLQLLYVARRNADGTVHGDVASYAAKWHGFFGSSEIELLAARHYVDDVLGLTLRVPLGGALMRTDVIGARLEADDEWYVSGILNIDYSFEVFRRSAFVFAEYFHNDFGVSELPATPLLLPQPLLDRLSRGELFNIMRDYLAVGATYQWHPLWTQSLLVIANLDDSSSLVQTSLSYERSDFTSLQFGITTVLGDAGDEFGGIPILPGVTTGGGTRAFLRFVYFR